MRQWFPFVVAKQNRRGPDENLSQRVDVGNSISREVGQNSRGSFLLWVSKCTFRTQPRVLGGILWLILK